MLAPTRPADGGAERARDRSRDVGAGSGNTVPQRRRRPGAHSGSEAYTVTAALLEQDARLDADGESLRAIQDLILVGDEANDASRVMISRIRVGPHGEFLRFRAMGV